MAELSNDPLGALIGDVTYDVNHQGSRAPRASGEGGRREAVRLHVLVQRVRRRRRHGRRDAARSTRRPPTRSARPWSSVISRRWPTTTSRRRSCATRPRSARRRACASTSCSTTCPAWHGRSTAIAMTSDGTPWRPLVHALDIAQAIRCALRADRERVHARSSTSAPTSTTTRCARSPRPSPTSSRAAS